MSKLRRRNVHGNRRIVRLRGTSTDRGCKATAALNARKGRVQNVYVSIAKVKGRHGCRFLNKKKKLQKVRNCRRPTLFKAHGTSKWRFAIRAHLPRGHYRVVARGFDTSGNKEKPHKRRNESGFTVR